MPPKSAKKKEKKGSKSPSQVAATAKIKELWACYENECKKQRVEPDPVLKLELKTAAAESKYKVKVIFFR